MNRNAKSTAHPCRLALLGGLLILAVQAAPAAADVRFGVRGGAYLDDADPFVGLELLMPLAEDWFFNPNVEFAFGDRRDTIALAGDVHYDFDVDSPYYVWAGGGPAVLFRNWDDDRRYDDDPPGNGDDTETDAGLDLLGGVGMRLDGGQVIYAQGKIIVTDDSEAVIAFGIRF